MRRVIPFVLAATGTACAQTVTVNTLEDVVDSPSPRRVEQLPGADGAVSLAEVIIATTNTAGGGSNRFVQGIHGVREERRSRVPLCPLKITRRFRAIRNVVEQRKSGLRPAREIEDIERGQRLAEGSR